jgi:beta-galactosidase
MRENFGDNWKFFLGDIQEAEKTDFDDTVWRMLNVPHDWSIEGEFSEDHPATIGGGALPGGIGWYRKSFSLSEEDSIRHIFIDFDGVYMDSKVWINGQLLGNRPNGYISFRYDLTPFLNYGDNINVIAVRVDNSLQPNSRWYSGSGIYRNVWLVKTHDVHVDHWGTYITTPHVNELSADIKILTTIKNESDETGEVVLKTIIYSPDGQKVASDVSDIKIEAGETGDLEQDMTISKPTLWSLEDPELYTAVSQVLNDNQMSDEYTTTFGIRYFEFDPVNGFSLNGQAVKINGVCNHHDLGCLGAAINVRALERQIEILKGMGCNGIRTAHNPPAPELLDLCDKMGIIVMDEVFDMWKKNKSPHDYARFWDEWHEKDLVDFMKRDRNHPSIFIWSIGNEILEQWDTTGIRMVQDLYHMTKMVDDTRPITTGNNPPSPGNNLTKPMILDLMGYNYAHKEYENFPETYPGQKFIATETVSGLATRGHYDMPSDSIRRWPYRWDQPFTEGNPDNTVSAYDNVSAPWGSTHEETWKIIKKHDYLSGQFIWTGFDYLGEPTPYEWPSRSSYFGIIDLAGFPKDIYYMYKSEWTDDPVLHIFPHWNWEEGDTVDMMAYFNCEEVELFLNEESQGTQTKDGDALHAMWRLAYTPGTIKAIGRSDGEVVLTKEIRTAGEPAQIVLEADRSTIIADGKDLSFITVSILDMNENFVPYANNLVNFKIGGEGRIVGVDNGLQTSHEPFKAEYRKAFNGKCLVVVQSGKEQGVIKLIASSENLEEATIEIQSR